MTDVRLLFTALPNLFGNTQDIQKATTHCLWLVSVSLEAAVHVMSGCRALYSYNVTMWPRIECVDYRMRLSAAGNRLAWTCWNRLCTPVDWYMHSPIQQQSLHSESLHLSTMSLIQCTMSDMIQSLSHLNHLCRTELRA